jgi:hypothetical protein
MAKLSTKQNPNISWWLLLVYIDGKAARRVLGLKP